MKINVRSDVNALLRQNRELRDEILKAAANAVNKTAVEVRKAAIEEVKDRNPGFTPYTLRGYITLRKAKYRKGGETASGALRKNYGGISATITAKGRAPNLIYFVSPAMRNPAAFRNAPGVSAKVLGKDITYNDTFVVRTKSGKMVVVSRSAMAKANPKGMRERGGKWRKGWSKGIYGPPLKSLAAGEQTFVVMRATARSQWPIHWKAASDAVLRGARAGEP